MDVIKMPGICVTPDKVFLSPEVEISPVGSMEPTSPWGRLVSIVDLDRFDLIFLDVSGIPDKALASRGRAVIIYDESNTKPMPKIIPLDPQPVEDEPGTGLEGVPREFDDPSSEIDDQSIVSLEKFADLYGANAAKIQLGMGLYLMGKGNYSRATMYLQAAVKSEKLREHPKDLAIAQVLLGICLKDAGNYIAAVSHFTSAIDSKNLNNSIWVRAKAELGCCLTSTFNYEQAILCLKYAIAVEKTLPESSKLHPEVLASAQQALVTAQTEFEERKQLQDCPFTEIYL